MNARAWILFAVGFGSGCSGDKTFPSGFEFGAAVAGFQVEMGCPTLPAAACEDRHSDWYQFITSTVTLSRASNHLQGDPPSAGPGFYELWEEDLDRLAGLGANAFRFSFEWSRIFPESTAGIDGYDALKARASTTALAYYHRQLAGMKSRGLKPLVTLNHYTMPTWILDPIGCNLHWQSCQPRGWADPKTIEEIAKYAGFAAREFGGEVDRWATLNEPLALVLFGLIAPSDQRSNPPAQQLQLVDARKAALNLIRAHARMYDAIHQNDLIDADGDGKAAEVGLVFPVVPVLPTDPNSALDQVAAIHVSYLYNDLFLNGVLLGKLDEQLDGTGVVQPDLVNRSDYLGVNFYFGITVTGDTQSALPDFSPLLTINPASAKPTGPIPKALYDTLLTLHGKYPSVPFTITENGAVEDVEGGQEKFMLEHLQWLQKAIDAGVDVRGYYWWSLMDNYEWNHGMTFPLGLFKVDPKDPNKTRVARPIAALYQSIIQKRGFTAEQQQRFPIQGP